MKFDREECKKLLNEMGITSERKIPKDPDLSEYSPEMRQKIIDGVDRLGVKIQKIADEEGISVQELWDRTLDYCAEQNKERRLGFKPPTEWKPDWKSDDGKPFHSGESIRLKRV